ncbi:MAG: hypothetical protein KGJ06_01765 [Pseudomonadota bacterium]|nr:hypothetical protein [Pseudomonadota bacterium]
MDDLRVVTILPTPATPGVQASPVAAGAGGQASALAKLTPGTILTGFIINRDAGGNPILRTDSGDIAFASNFFLRIGSEVVLRVENTGGQPLAHILSIDGQPPEVAQTLSAFANQPEIIVSDHLAQASSPAAAAATQAAAPNMPPPQPSITVSAMVIGAPNVPYASVLPTGTQLALKLTALIPPSSPIPEEIAALVAPPIPASPTQAVNPTSAASYAVYTRTTDIPAAAPPAVATASTVPAAQAPALQTEIAPATLPTAPVPPVSMPSSPNPPIPLPQSPAPAAPTTTTVIYPAPTMQQMPAPSVGQTLVAAVIGAEPSGEAIAQTPMGMLRLPADIRLPVGSTAMFEIARIDTPEAAATSARAASPAPLLELAQQWNSLQQIVDLLASHSVPPLYAIQNHLPTALPMATMSPSVAPPGVSSGLMFFLSALRGGDFRNWLGQSNSAWLQDEGHGPLLRRAEAEFQQLARQYADAPPGRWQALFFPVAVEGEMHQTRLFVKRDRRQQDGNAPGKKNDDTRFIVEVDLTQLGEMQMDGFVRRRDREVQFDMVIRSLRPLSQEIQQDILQLYNSAGELTGYRGSLSFQAVRDFPVNPMQELARGEGPVTA